MSALGTTLRRSWPVLVSYGLFSMWGVACFVLSLVLTNGGFGVDPEDISVLAGVLGATFVGHILGNVLGLVGLRMLPVVVLFVIASTLAGLSGAVIGPVALFLFVGLFAALGGYLGIASRLDVVAAWFPLSFSVGAAMIWMNHHGALGKFQSGAKHAVWDGFSITCLSGGIFLMLVFLAMRNALGLTVWQEVARPRGPVVAEPSVSVARPGRGSLFVLFAFTLVVLGVTALVSPYLFRTVESKGGDGQGQSSSSDGKESKEDKEGNGKDGQQGQGKQGQGKQGQGEGEHGADEKDGQGHEKAAGKSGQGKKSGKGKKQGSGGEGNEGGEQDSSDDDPLGKPDTDHAGEAAGEALGFGLTLFMWLLLAVLALLVLLLIAFPPLRRAFLLRHLERPLWPVAPTARVMNLWRRALALLAVVDIVPSAGETPRDFARRAEREIGTTLGCDARGLSEAAAIVERVDYAGRGLGADDEQTMRTAVMAFVGAVNPRIALGKKLAAAWVRTPEVES